MSRVENIKGDVIRQLIFGVTEHEDRTEYDKYRYVFYHSGSSNRQAQRSMNPNSEPIGFCIPSEWYTDHSYREQSRISGGKYYTDEEWAERIIPPTYIVEGGLHMGGYFDYNTSVLTLKEAKTNIRIGKCLFKHSIDIHQFVSTYSIQFNHCTFNEDIRFWNVKSKDISFKNCDFNGKKIHVLDCSLERLILENCKNFSVLIQNDIKKEVEYKIANDFDHSIKLIDFIELENVETLHIFGKGINEIKFKNSTIRETKFHLDIDNLSIINSFLDSRYRYVTINEFVANVNGQKENYISLLENIHIGYFALTGTLKNSTVNIVDVKIDKFVIHDFVNEGKLRFNDVKLSIDGECEITRTQFSKTEFNYVDFSKAKSFKIYLSNITEIIINNTTFPENIVGKSGDDFYGVREIYRQLKNAAGKQGDRINELYYEKLEMITFEKALQLSNNWNDRFILWTNKISNGYGQDWTLALSVLLVGCLCLFCAIKLTLYSMHFDSPPNFGHVAQYINFTLNPLHKFSDIFYDQPKDVPDNQLGFAQVLDAISRLFSGYMIFQFLKAFRKYVR